MFAKVFLLSMSSTGFQVAALNTVFAPYAAQNAICGSVYRAQRHAASRRRQAFAAARRACGAPDTPPSPTARTAKLRTVGLGGLALRTAPKQFPTDRRGAASQQQADRLKTRPAPMLRQNHATFLAVEVLVPLSIAISYTPRALVVALDV
jgi:hypothetical protein